MIIELFLFAGLVAAFIQIRNLRLRLDALDSRDEYAPVPVAAPPPTHTSAPATKIPVRTAPALKAAARPETKAMIGETPAAAPPEIPSDEEPREALGAFFERLVGGRLLIWVGGIALALAGIYLVGYSIELGLITPPVQIFMAAAFGLLLLAAGEFARRRQGQFPDPRIGQALTGAAILVLYATPYAALEVHGLVSNATASIAMVAVTALALLLALRHGAPTAILGLAGGFAVPLLVGDPDAGVVPMLAYLGLLDVAIFAIALRRGWTWLVAGAVVLSFVWAAALLAGPPDDALASGVFVLIVALAASLGPIPGTRVGEGGRIRDWPWPAGGGLLLLAILAGRADVGPVAWLLFGLLAGASILLGLARSSFRLLPAFALGLALLLTWSRAIDSPDRMSAIAAAATTLMFGGTALLLALRSDGAARAARGFWYYIGPLAFAAPVLIMRTTRPEPATEIEWGLMILGLAIGPALLAWRGVAGEGLLRFSRASAVGAAMLLAGAAALDLLPEGWIAAAWLALAAAAAFLHNRWRDDGVAVLAAIATVLGWFAVIYATGALWSGIGWSLFGELLLAPMLPSAGLAATSLALPALLTFFTWRWLDARRRGWVLAGAVILALAFVFTLFKQAWGLSSTEDFVVRGFAERLILTQALFAAGWLLAREKLRVPGLEGDDLRRIGFALTALAAARLVWLDMLVFNPALRDQWVGSLPFANLLALAFLPSAWWLYDARRRTPRGPRSGMWLAATLAALIAWTGLAVRQLFHGPLLATPTMSNSEFYAYSLAGLILSVALFLAGLRIPDKALRLAGLTLLTATIVKVFVFDAAALEGLLRIFSFLGLGIGLIGVGRIYASVLRSEARAPKAVSAARESD